MADPTREAEARRTLEGVLTRGVVPDSRTEALLGCLSAVEMAHRVIPTADPKTVQSVAADHRQRNWGAKEARDAHDGDMAAAIVVTGIAP